MKEFIVLTCDGYTEDNLNQLRDNMQVLDFIDAYSFKEAKEIAMNKNYGAYSDIRIYEIKREKM